MKYTYIFFIIFFLFFGKNIKAQETFNFLSGNFSKSFYNPAITPGSGFKYIYSNYQNGLFSSNNQAIEGSILLKVGGEIKKKKNIQFNQGLFLGLKLNYQNEKPLEKLALSEFYYIGGNSIYQLSQRTKFALGVGYRGYRINLNSNSTGIYASDIQILDMNVLVNQKEPDFNDWANFSALNVGIQFQTKIEKIEIGLGGGLNQNIGQSNIVKNPLPNTNYFGKIDLMAWHINTSLKWHLDPTNDGKKQFDHRISKNNVFIGYDLYNNSIFQYRKFFGGYQYNNRNFNFFVDGYYKKMNTFSTFGASARINFTPSQTNFQVLCGFMYEFGQNTSQLQVPVGITFEKNALDWIGY